MRRTRILNLKPYIVPLKQQMDRVLVLSDNILLERTYHSNPEPEMDVHARFNGSSMNGLMIMAALRRGAQTLHSVLTDARIYRISDSTWAETLIGSVSLTAGTNSIFTGSINQATLGANELSGRETYSLEVELQRHFRRFRKKVWFNHLGIYDTANMARQAIESLDVLKVDE